MRASFAHVPSSLPLDLLRNETDFVSVPAMSLLEQMDVEGVRTLCDVLFDIVDGTEKLCSASVSNREIGMFGCMPMDARDG